MRPIDRAAMERLFVVNNDILSAYQQYDFTAVFHALTDYCTVDLSAYYLDIIKDRLYVEQADGAARRSAQTACWYILDTMTRLIAPILSFTAEQLADHYQSNGHASIHLQDFAALEEVQEWLVPDGASKGICSSGCCCGDDSGDVEQGQRALELCLEHAQTWETIKAMRSVVLKALEGLREQAIIKHSLEARVTLRLDDTAQATLRQVLGNEQSIEQFWQEYVIVSQIVLTQSSEGLTATDIKGLSVGVERAHGDKCPRCWQWSETQDSDKLCSRCQTIVMR
jgi:isoleucyl-tRNA synthetase